MWEPRSLNSGAVIPGIAFGTAYTSKEDLGPRVLHAIQAGFRHFDTAQGKAYDNEQQLGEALAASGVPRSDLFVCTKWSNHKETTPLEACRASLKLLGMDYVDLYLIHQPRNCEDDIPGTWKLMEEIRAMGLAKDIGVCNFKYDDLRTLLSSCSVPPAVNQIYLSPNNFAASRPLLELATENGVLTEAYWMLRSLTDETPQPIVESARSIATRRKCEADQVILAWGETKGVIPITSSSKLARLQGYMAAVQVHLDEQDIAEMEAAGALAKGELPWSQP